MKTAKTINMKYFIWVICMAAILLLDSCTSDFYTLDDFKSVKKIDTHTHLMTTSTALTEQAREDNFRLLDVSVDYPPYPTLAVQQQFALHQIEKFPDRVRFLTAFTLNRWDSAGWADETITKLKTSFAAGALGIKLWKNMGMVYKDSAGHFIMLDNPRFDSVIQFIINQDKTLIGHFVQPTN